MYTVSIDIGGTYIKHALFSENEVMIMQAKVATPKNKESFKEALVTIINEYGSAYPIDGVGLSVPGYINNENGYAEKAGSLFFLDGINFISLIQDEVPYPVFIDNDANCAALSESFSGNAKGLTDFFVMTLGTAVGGALYLNGGLYRGGQFKAGEFSLMRINYGQAPNRTFYEYASASALLYRYQALKGQSAGEVSGERIFEEFNTDEEVKQLVLDWVDDICVGIFNVVCILNPQRVLIGGGVSANPLLVPLINERMKELYRWDHFEVPIVPCKYRNTAGVLGAYYMVKKGLNKEAQYLKEEIK
ncbi:ROK family protein [Jeotgalibaca caeni]|uniref:ROK family protein n=1 Tax=Jeotgalibaca caeni TaxID=3028623 RepID=UPI00237E9096|nr:ROK family protein [Jeotgalibaca caeni]MDE1549699.1 ROK family protein [Jeotgalibaca caeni]